MSVQDERRDGRMDPDDPIGAGADDLIALPRSAPRASLGGLLIAGAGGLAAFALLVAFAVGLRTSDERDGEEPRPEIAAVAPESAMPPAVSVPRAPAPQTDDPRQPDTTGALALPRPLPSRLPEAVPAPQPKAEAPAVAALAPPAADPAPAAAPAPAAVAPVTAAPPATTLPAEEIDALLAKGEGHLEAGDVAVARLYFERVADAGDARGATGMARSFDEAVLSGLPVIGKAADPEAARSWSERARALAATAAR